MIITIRMASVDMPEHVFDAYAMTIRWHLDRQPGIELVSGIRCTPTPRGTNLVLRVTGRATHIAYVMDHRLIPGLPGATWRISRSRIVGYDVWRPADNQLHTVWNAEEDYDAHQSKGG